VDAPVLAEQPRERVDVGARELRELTVRQDLVGDGVQRRQRRKHACIGGVAGLRLALCRQPELLEQHLAELFGRIDRELTARELVDLGRKRRDLGVRLDRERVEHLPVEADAGPLHAHEDRNERHLDLGEASRGPPLLKAGFEHRREFGGGARFGGNVARLDGATEMLGRERGDVVAGAVRGQQVAGDAAVEEPRRVELGRGPRERLRAHRLRKRLDVAGAHRAALEDAAPRLGRRVPRERDDRTVAREGHRLLASEQARPVARADRDAHGAPGVRGPCADAG